jgi:F0F1-type ATP synthase delta subunit
MIREKLKEKLNRQMKIDNKELKEIIGAVSDKIFDSYS